MQSRQEQKSPEGIHDGRENSNIQDKESVKEEGRQAEGLGDEHVSTNPLDGSIIPERPAHYQSSRCKKSSSPNTPEAGSSSGPSDALADLSAFVSRTITIIDALPSDTSYGVVKQTVEDIIGRMNDNAEWFLVLVLALEAKSGQDGEWARTTRVSLYGEMISGIHTELQSLVGNEDKRAHFKIALEQSKMYLLKACKEELKQSEDVDDNSRWNPELFSVTRNVLCDFDGVPLGRNVLDALDIIHLMVSNHNLFAPGNLDVFVDFVRQFGPTVDLYPNHKLTLDEHMRFLARRAREPSEIGRNADIRTQLHAQLYVIVLLSMWRAGSWDTVSVLNSFCSVN
jgi:hypothetical protein